MVLMAFGMRLVALFIAPVHWFVYLAALKKILIYTRTENGYSDKQMCH